MSFPGDDDARRFLELRERDPAAFAALPERAQEMAQMYADTQAMREHRPAQKWSRRDEHNDQLLALRDSEVTEDRQRYRDLPDRTRDELQAYEDVVGRPSA